MDHRMSSVSVLALACFLLLPSPASAMLHPVQNRFLQRDPDGYQDGSYLYSCSKSNPMTRIDPTGRKAEVVFADAPKEDDIQPIYLPSNELLQKYNENREKKATDPPPAFVRGGPVRQVQYGHKLDKPVCCCWYEKVEFSLQLNLYAKNTLRDGGPASVFDSPKPGKISQGKTGPIWREHELQHIKDAIDVYNEEDWRDSIRKTVSQYDNDPPGEVFSVVGIDDEEMCLKFCHDMLYYLVRPIAAQLRMDARAKDWDDADYPDDAMPRD